MKKIVFLDEYSMNGGDLSPVKEQGDYKGYYDSTPDQVVSRAAGADILIVNKIRITRRVMESLPELKLICVAATGMNNIDIDAAEDHGIQVKNARGYSTHSVAETTLGGALALLREIVYYDRYVKSGEYASSPRPFNYDRATHQLYGKNWGIIGLGAIGHEVARLAHAFGCDVAYYSASGVDRKEKYPKKELAELLEWSDIVSIHAPLTDKTKDLVGSRELSAMKPSSIIINVARGGIVNEQALADALDGGLIAGAVADVFTDEPIKPENPLLHIKDPYKLLLSPHNAWSADKAIEALIGCIADNIREYLDSK